MNAASTDTASGIHNACARSTTTRAGLARIFDARSVAVVGASSDPTRIGGRPIQVLHAAGFDGQIYPVNPARAEIQGLRCYPSLRDVPGPVDLVICALPASGVEAVVDDCAAKSVAGMVVFAAGFAETGDKGLQSQSRMIARAASHGLRVIGPNCLGLFRARNHLSASFHPAFGKTLPPGRLSLVSQSGAFASMAMHMAAQRGVGFSHVITTGNEGDVDVAECIDYLTEDEDTAVILLYLEGVRDGPRMIEALDKAQRLRKPIVAVKLGSSAVGARAAASHTAALAGTDHVYDAIFRQFGVYRARSIEEFYDVGVALSIGGLPRGRRTALVTVSGGVGVLMADDAAARGLDVAPMSESVQRQVKNLVPFAGTQNPLDVTGVVVNDPELLYRAMRLVLESDAYDAFAIFQGGLLLDDASVEPNLAMWKRLRAAFADRPIYLCGPTPRGFRSCAESEGIVCFDEPTHATRAAAAGAQIYESMARNRRPERIAPPGSRLAARRYSEPQALQWLAGFGIPCVPFRVVRDAAAAAAAGAEFGWPAVLKIVSADITHKSDVGGVVLDIASAPDMEAAFDTVMASARLLAPGVQPEGAMVAPMIRGGIETIMGVHRDPVFGPVVMFGLGGVHVEVLKDVTFRLAPFDHREARRMVDEIRGRPILDGIRGAPAVDMDALCDALVALSRCAFEHRDDLASIDVNPLLVLPRGQGCLAVDAVIIPAADELHHAPT